MSRDGDRLDPSLQDLLERGRIVRRLPDVVRTRALARARATIAAAASGAPAFAPATAVRSRAGGGSPWRRRWPWPSARRVRRSPFAAGPSTVLNPLLRRARARSRTRAPHGAIVRQRIRAPFHTQSRKRSRVQDGRYRPKNPMQPSWPCFSAPRLRIRAGTFRARGHWWPSMRDSSRTGAWPRIGRHCAFDRSQAPGMPTKRAAPSRRSPIGFPAACSYPDFRRPPPDD